MHSSQIWLQYNIPSDALAIKAEPEPDLSLISPPNSPFLSPTLTNSSLPTSVCRRRSYSLASPKQRVRPYPAQRLSRSTRTEDFNTMSNPHGYGWRGGMKPNERRSSDGDPVYGTVAMASVPYGTRSDHRQSTSSLHHAMGPDAASTSSPRMQMNMNPMSPMWTQGAVMDANDPSMYPGVAGPYFNPSDVNASFDMRQPGSQSPEPFTTFTNPFPANPTSSYSPNPNFQSTTAHYPSPNSGPPSTSPSDEFRRLQQKIQELERLREQDQERIRALETQLTSHSYPSSRGSSSPPVSPSFQASWKARTDARTKIYCSLNRAGNALCAWHDSRRERRQFPPRNAPEGFLNCGCTYEEALFEESLASHNVGSYLPGETVRMDPALRNPLLKLLQTRYGYRDGDFDRDPRTGDWLPGEGLPKWEQRLREGHTNPRRPRPTSDHERR